MKLDEQMLFATKAMREREFGVAESTLKQALQTCEVLEDQQLILGLLAICFIHPLNEDFDRAEAYIAESEHLHPSASNAMRYAYFYQNVTQDSVKARNWAGVARQRAAQEQNTFNLYEATAVAGLLAARDKDRPAIDEALAEIHKLLQSPDERISYGDAVRFLEAISEIDQDLAQRAKHLATMIAPKIEDAEFRGRAENLASPQR